MLLGKYIPEGNVCLFTPGPVCQTYLLGMYMFLGTDIHEKTNGMYLREKHTYRKIVGMYVSQNTYIPVIGMYVCGTHTYLDNHEYVCLWETYRPRHSCVCIFAGNIHNIHTSQRGPAKHTYLDFCMIVRFPETYIPMILRYVRFEHTYIHTYIHTYLDGGEAGDAYHTPTNLQKQGMYVTPLGFLLNCDHVITFDQNW